MYFACKFPHWAGAVTAMKGQDLEGAGTQVVPILLITPAPALHLSPGGPQPTSNIEHRDRGRVCCRNTALQA